MKYVGFGAMLKEHARHFPAKTAVIAEYGDRSWTYGYFNERINRLANALMGLGLQKGDHVAIMSMNRGEYAEVFLALNKAGMVCVTVNFLYVADELAYVLQNSEAKALIFEGQYVEVAHQVHQRAECEQVRFYINLDDGTKDFYLGYEDLLARASSLEPGVEVNDTDDSLIIYTSGTTARPKGAIKTEGAVLWFGLQIAYSHEIHPYKTWMCPTPQYHLGSEMETHLLLYVGGTIVIPRKFDPEKTLYFLEKYRVNGMFLTPAILNLSLNVPGKEKYDVSSLDHFVASGGPLLEDTKIRAKEYFRNCKIHNLYASTEFGGATQLLDEEAEGKSIDNIGYPCLGSSVKIGDEDGNELPRGEAGRIWVKNGAMNYEYYNNPEVNAKNFRDGWIAVGDMGFHDEEGYFHFSDRDKDLIVSGGENIGSVEVEQVLITHPKVAEVAVIGVPSARWGEEAKAVIVLRRGETATEEEIRDFCRGRMAGFKIPKSVDFVSELPKTATGKVLKTDLREKYRKEMPTK